MELMFYSSKKKVSSQKEEWKSSKYQSLPVKLCLPTWWDFWKRDVARNSFKPCKSLRKAIQKLTRVSTLKNLEEICFRNMGSSKTPWILLATQLPSTQTIASCTGLQSSLSAKFSSTWILWVKILPLSSIQFSVWVAFLKVFQGSAL